MTPGFNSGLGKLWLERGGTGVISHIRGGREFGTSWYEAARREGRRLAHDDFAAVAADLVGRGVTRPGRIAATGGSNGGLLIANMLTRYPERFGALYCAVPVTDMRRFAKLLIGPALIDEFGDPDDPQDWKFLAGISAYHVAAPGKTYPPILISTSRRDDRAHPGHARKMAAKLQAMGYQAHFYEPATGGHALGKDNEEQATHISLGILASTSPSMVALLQVTRTVPIVFVQVADPVDAGFVVRLGRPGGNATGFTLFDYSVSGKWVELLREIAPGVKRAAVLRDPASPAAIGQFAVIQTVASPLGVEVTPLDVRDAAEIKPAIKSFALSSNVGLIVAASIVAALDHEVTVTQAARYRLPAIYSDRAFVIRGGLISYGPDRIESYRHAAAYVDRILKGEKPADLPVQTPTRSPSTLCR
jgi:dienelactone hydrolase